MTLTWMHILLGALVLWNLAAFATYGIDKRAARHGKRRIPEKMLLLLAALFGAAGSLSAMLLFRHKTKKKKFTILVPLFLLVQLFLLYELGVQSMLL